MKKEIFAIEESNSYITERFSKALGIKKVRLFNDCIHSFFEPHTDRLKGYYEDLFARFNEWQRPSQTTGSEDELILVPDQRELIKYVWRTIQYCSWHPIKHCGPLKRIFVSNYWATTDKYEWKKNQNEVLNKHIEDAYKMLNEKIPMYGTEGPLQMMECIFDYWEFFWNREEAYELLEDIVCFWPAKQEFTFYSVITFLHDVDELILSDLLRKEKVNMLKKTTNGKDEGGMKDDV